MIYIILINILLIIWLYYKFQYITKNNSIGSINVEELSPSVIGYIDDPNGNVMDWILAEILELNKNEYIEIIYQRQDIDKYGYIIQKKEKVDLSKLKKHQLTSYRLLFSDCVDIITMDRLEENIRRSFAEYHEARVKGINIKNEVEELLEEEGIIDYKKRKKLQNIRNIYLVISIILLIVIKNISIIQLLIFLLESMCVFYICQNARCFTEKGKNIYWKIKEYKQNLKNNKLLKEKKLVHNMLLGKYYINSIALHIASDARNEFINDEIEEKKIKKILYKMKGFIYVIILFIIGMMVMSI